MPKKAVDWELKKRFYAVFMDSGLSQAEFGRRVGQLQHAISQVIGGDREPSKAMLQAAITEFDIAPEWLYSGAGAMRKQKAADSEYVTRDVFWKEIGILEGRLRVLTQAIGGLGGPKSPAHDPAAPA